jgi:hypothetical protein
MPKGKAQADAKAQHTCKYVSILRRFATPPLGIRCIFEIGSKRTWNFEMVKSFKEIQRNS